MSVDVGTTQFFRANVGIAIVNGDGHVLALERAEEKAKGDGTIEYVGTDQWQMAQGGLDKDDNEVKSGAMRELEEELGLESGDVELLFEYPDWLAYELPLDARQGKHGRGQVQKWFFYRLTTSDSKISLTGHGEKREFMRFKWMELSELAKITWEVRRPIYDRLAAELVKHL